MRELKREKFKKFRGEECWIWAGDGSDELETLMCPVVISPSDLLEIISRAESAPDVAGLIVLLEHAQCPNCDGSGARYDSHGEPEQCQWCYERAAALAAHRKGGEA